MSRTYDNPERVWYPIIGVTTSNITRHFRGPKGLTGRVADILMSTTTSFVDVSATTKVQVGISGTVGQNASWAPGTPAAASADAASEHAGAILSQGSRPADGSIAADAPYLQPSTDVFVTWTAPTGSGAAGVADLLVGIDWFQ